MSDLINRDDFINSIVCSVSSPCETKQEQRDAQFKQKYTVDAFIKELKRAPAVEAVEVVRAHWINSSNRKYGNLDPEFRCSNCEEIYWYFGVESFEFCPNCGAKMDKRKESEVSE